MAVIEELPPLPVNLISQAFQFGLLVLAQARRLVPKPLLVDVRPGQSGAWAVSLPEPSRTCATATMPSPGSGGRRWFSARANSPSDSIASSI